MNVRRLVLVALCTMTGALVLSVAPALAATGNVYKSQFTRGETEEKPFFPYLMTFNASGDVYVFDRERGVIDEFNSSGGGEALMEFRRSEAIYAEGLAVNASGDLFVSEYEREVVYEFEPDGELLREITGDKTNAASFHPAGVVVNSSGDLLVADYPDGVVDEFGPAAFEADLTGPPIREFSVSEPVFIAVDASSGDLYVTGYEAGGIHEFEPDGTSLAFNDSGTPHESSFSPGAVAVAPSGEVYIADTANDVVDRFSSTGTYESQFEGAETPQGSFGSFGYIGGALAVNAGEEVYVSDGEHQVIDEFSKAVPVPVVTTGAASEVLQTTATLTGNIEPSGGLEASCEFRYSGPGGSSTVPCEPAGPFSSSLNQVKAKISGLTRETAYGYRLLGSTPEGTTPGAEQPFTTLGKIVSPPTVSIEPVTPIAQNSATFKGKVNANEAATTYHFEYSTEAAGTNWTPLAEQSAGEGPSEVLVTETATGLTGHTTYYVRLAAKNHCETGVTGCGANTSADETFTTLAGPPRVSGTAATNITAGEATLHATIYPENQPSTTYRFEYGTTTAYGTVTPVAEGHIGSTPTPVTQAITGLAPDTTYHFRVVSSNGVGLPTTTVDQTFTTYSSTQASAGCPNEQVRSASDVNPATGVPFSQMLPECRAYEMVSPPLKNGAVLNTDLFQFAGKGSFVQRVGTEGDTVLVSSTGDWQSTEQPGDNNLRSTDGSEAVLYKVTRGRSGWAFTPEAPPAADVREFGHFIMPHGNDLGENPVVSGIGFSPIEENKSYEADPNLYKTETDGAFAEIGPSGPPTFISLVQKENLALIGVIPRSGGGETKHPIVADGSSTDLSHVLFEDGEVRWPFDDTKLTTGLIQKAIGGGAIPSLYEYIGSGHTGEGSDVPTLVGVDNTGALISQCGTEAGKGPEGLIEEWENPEARTVSEGGSTVFFTALPAGAKCNEYSSDGDGTGPAAKDLFARVGEPGPGADLGDTVTVNVAGTSGCVTDSCNVTQAVTYQGASADGSKVFFTSEQPLVANETDSTTSLYECRLPGDSGVPLTRMTPVNRCPNLVDVSAGSSSDAQVQSVVAISQDGSHVYFIAKGVLSGENAEHDSPTLGKENLYVWQEASAGYPHGHTAFIATAPELPSAPEEAQATPDGDSLVFTSPADLTPDDTSTVSQVFLYEASREALIRVSKGQDGFDNDGNTTTDPATITPDSRRSISEDGTTVVFQSSAALTPQVHGGTRNVYLWRGGNVYLISDGTPAGEHEGQEDAGLIGIDATSANVFFTTEAQLVGQDTDELSDLYDARIDGGFPAPTVDECVGESCQGALPSSLGPVAPGSLSSSGQGNLAPPGKATSKLPPKPLTRAQKLASALKVCAKDKAKKKRARCEAAAHKRYGAKHRAKKRPAGKPIGNGGKR